MKGDTRIIDLTVEELVNVIHTAMEKPIQKKEFLRGYTEIAVRYGVNYKTAYRWVKSGLFDDAVYRNGNVITFDAVKFDDIFKNFKQWKKQA